MPLMPPAKKTRWSWRSHTLRSRVYQALVVGVIVGLLWWLAANTAHNMQTRGIQSGFDFLTQPAGFDIGETVLPFDSSEAYWRAFGAGLLNTLRVALPGIFLATVLGTLLGAGRFSRSVLARGLCATYVELFRNIPLLLQLLMWYLLLAQALPPIDSPWVSGPLQLSKNGLAWHGAQSSEATLTLSPEFLALLLGLSLYTAAFVAEVVRAGIAAVPRGQSEAAATLGLSPRQTLRQVVLPQALRVIIPPLTNQYLNLTKNSSLAVAIGYPDVLSIANTAINQTGRAVECIAIVMAVYLSTSLLTSLAMNRYNARSAIRER